MEVLGKVAKELENFLKKRKSSSVEKNIEKFYSEYFGTDMEEPGKINIRGMSPVGNQKRAVHKDVLSNVNKIEVEAENLGIPSVSLAGYCYVRLMDDAITVMVKHDGKMSEEFESTSGLYAGDIKEILDSGKVEELEKELEFTTRKYNTSYQKTEACRRIAEEYDLGDVFTEIAERNSERLERRGKYFNVAEEALEEGNVEEAKAAFSEFEKFVEGQTKQIMKEQKAIRENTERWMAEHS